MSVTRYCQAGHKFIIDGTMAEGETITVTVEPADGYSFSSWDDGITANPRQIYIDSCGEVFTARFTSSGPTPPPSGGPYTICVDLYPMSGSAGTPVGPAGTATVNGQECVTVNHGDQICLKAFLNPGYTFSTWNNPNGTAIAYQSEYCLTATMGGTYKAFAKYDGVTPPPTTTTFYWKSSNNINDLRVPISNYNQRTYTSTPTSVTAGAEGTATGFGKYTAFVVPTGKSVSGVWKDALGGNGTVTFSSNNGCYATGVPSGYTCLLGNPGTSGVSGYQSATFTIQ